jgi:proteasome accessory factor C
VERLTDLVLVLLHTSTPRTLEEIAHAVPGYPESHAARRQAFERDKRILRDEGIPVVTEPIDGPEQYGYRIDPESFYLRDLELEEDEQAALHLAVAGVHLGDPHGRDALAKLGASGMAEARQVAAVSAPPALVPLFDAVRSQSEVRFTYHSEARVVAPATLQFRGGHWYLVGWDRRRDAPRTFRIDRIDALAAPGPPGSGELPDAFDPADATVEPWRAADEDTEHVLLRVDAVEGPRVAAEVGEAAVLQRHEDGSVLLRLGVSSFDVLRSWVLGLLDHAEIVGPRAARQAMAEWLDATLAATLESDGAPVAALGEPPVQDGAPSPGRPGAVPVASPRGASARLGRLLAIVAWLAEVGEAPIAELCARFDIGQDELVRELELAACCGLPPYSPDTLLEIVVSDETVQAFLPKELARPRRLTPAEGLALAASARTILAVPGADADGSLGRALAKLDAVLGDDRRLVIRLDAPPLLEAIQHLVGAGVQAEIEYHSASTDETTVRTVEPIEVTSLDGHWYLDAYCHRAGGVRRFRVDRIRTVRSLDVPARATTPARAGDDAFVPGPGAILVTLLVGPEGRWVLDTVPVLSRHERPRTTVEVTLAVGGRAWLERLLLQLGPRARVVSPIELAGAGAAAAGRLRRRYGENIMTQHETSSYRPPCR